MSTNSDQNPDQPQALSEALSDDSAGEPLNFDEIDQAIKEVDPQFLNKVSHIKIDTGGRNLNADVSGDSTVYRPQMTWAQLIKKPFLYKDNPATFIKFWASVVVIMILIGVTWLNKKSFLSDQLFIQSLAELGAPVNEFNPLTESESFYDNPQFSKNLMTMSKMVVNLKESENSGPNPMLALEINVEGLSAEAIIELKDREAEFKDHLLRWLEEKSYDDLVTAKGKQDMCDDFRALINSHLTQGQVRRVLLNSFVIKP